MQLIAEYFNISAAAKRQQPGKIGQIQIIRIESGNRTMVTNCNVAGKTEARRIASAFNATPWNF